MCIIAVKPSSKQMFDDAIIKQMFFRNRDGAGLMWTEDETVHFKKGFMTVQEILVCHHDKKCSISATLLNIFPKIKKWPTPKRVGRFFRSHLFWVGYTASGISTFIYIIHNMVNYSDL